MTTLPRHFQLTGGDYFIHAIDRQMRQAGMPGNICRMVLHLEGTPDVARLRARLTASPLCAWLGRVRMIRLLPVLSPLWRAGGDGCEEILHEHSVTGTIPPDDPLALPAAVRERELRAGRRPAVALDLVHHAGGDAHLVLSWHHALMDVRGAELLLRHIQGDSATATDPIDPEQRSFRLGRLWRGYPRKVCFARESLAFITTTCREPFFSLLPAPRPARPCRNEYRIIHFDATETARIDAHCLRLNAGFRRSHFYLAAAARAFHAVAAGRGNEDAAYVVPVPHDLRRRGADGPIFSNQISFLFYRIEAGQAPSLEATISELTRQMMDQIRNRNPESFIAAMELFKPTPLDFYVSQLGRPTRGKFSTFFFSDAGESCAGMEELAGARLAGVTHLAPASRPPGLTVVFSRFRGRLGVVLAYVDDCLAPAEVAQLERGMRAALLGEVAS